MQEALHRKTQTLTVAQEGFLEWLPQENIFFPDAQGVCLTTHIHLASSAEIYRLGNAVFWTPSFKMSGFETGKVKRALKFLC